MSYKGKHVGHTKTTIELNGNLYDANTGAMLNSSPSSSPKPKKTSGGGVVDGFFRGPTPVALSPVNKTVPQSTKPPGRPKSTAAKAGHHTERSHTLMRQVLSKPKLTPPATAPSQVKEQGLTPPNSFWQDRKKRAQQTTKSSLISHFGNLVNPPSSVKTKVAPLAVQPHPSERLAKKAAVSLQSVQLGQAALGDTVTTGSQAFQKALQTAQSHTKKAASKPKLRHKAAKKLGVSNHALNIASAVLVVVLLTGFVAYQNVPNLSMRLASSRAGFHAALPGYTPSGFGMAGPIKTNPGVVIVSFRSNSDNRSFNVSQKESNWTSDSLLNNFVASNKTYQVLQDKGKTIYVYNGSNATWVNGGIWYQVAGDANLSNSQLLHIADSL